MNTGSTAGADSATAGAGPTPRIVRIARAIGPIAAAGLVVATVWVAAPHSAWLPWLGAQPPADAWAATLPWPQDVLASVQTRLGELVWPRNAVAGAIGVAAAVSALVALVLAAALRATGLGVPLAALVATLAAAGPLLAWQAGSPLGGAPASLASALLLWRFVRRRVRMHVTWFGSLAATAAVALGIVTVLAVSALLAWVIGAWPASATLRIMRAEVGLPGLVLLFPALGRRHTAVVPRERVWLAAALLWLLTTPLAPTTRAAILLPWVWWLIGAGVAQLVAWRGRHAARWAAVGVAVWIAIHAARVPWGQQHQRAALTRTWAEGVAVSADERHPVVFEDSARGRLLAALVEAEGQRTVPLADAREATRAGLHPVAGDSQVDALRWGGVALDALPRPVGVPLERILDALPRGTIVLAAISREAARAITPDQWQALGRLGLRLADAGTPRGHALAGVARTRVEALEVAHADAARIDLLPGDPLGRTGVRSPVDARIEAGAHAVTVSLRGQPFIQDAALGLLVFSTRGDFLGWRIGDSPAHLDGPPLGSGPLVRGMGVEVLPCVDLQAGVDTDIGQLTDTGALGITWSAAGDVRLRLSVAAPGERAEPRLVGEPKDTSLPTLTRQSADEHLLVRKPWQRTSAGILLRGPLERARAMATVPVRVCAAWPMAQAIDPTEGRVAMPMLPRFEPHFGGGWHDAEVAGGTYFRWMDGGRASVLLALRRVAPLRLTLDAQGVTAPGPDDVVRLVVNGRPVGERPVLATRGLYEWDVPSDALREGLNTFVFETTLTLRPADLAPGTDSRTLGLLVYGWTLEPAEPRK